MKARPAIGRMREDGVCVRVARADEFMALAGRVAELEQRVEATARQSTSPFMTIVEAAEFLRCSRQRVDDLLSQRRLTRFKDGSRTLLSRAEVEEHLGKDRR